MSERLDRLEVFLAQSARESAVRMAQIEESNQQSTVRLNRIEEILADTAVKQAQNTEGIDTLLGAASTAEVERRESRQRFETEMAESNQRFENLRLEAIADRQRSDRQFQAMQETLQRLFLEIRHTNSRVDNLEQAS